MIKMIMPLATAVLGAVLYNICTRSVPQNVNAFLSLGITYITAAIVSIAIYLIGEKNDFTAQLHEMNFYSVLLGISVVIMEFGYIWLYRSGWKMSAGSLAVNIVLACVLVIAGNIFYHEEITIKQIVGMVICFVGVIVVSV